MATLIENITEIENELQQKKVESSKSVKLISYSKSVFSPDDSMVQMIAYCARVSNPLNQDISNIEKDEKLIQYLIKNNHWSPFEMVHICLEINTTRDIARQILRHRSFSFQEFSQRYAEYNNDFIFRDVRLQDYKNRQNSIEIENEVDCDADTELQKRKIINEWKKKQQIVMKNAKDTYKWAIECGIAKEQARIVLPEGMTHSRLYVSGTLRSWIHYIQLRTENGTQKEHRIIANECKEVISTIFPIIYNF
jgi:thymidylate synthase (FAD)